MNLLDAITLANRAMDYLKQYCERIEIAGSIRRRKPEVKDIELVAVPNMLDALDLFGVVIGRHSVLNNRAVFEPLGVVMKGGERYVQVSLPVTVGLVNLDLFVVMPPAQWGVLMAIRTGPADFSKWIVTPRSKGGALHNGWRCEDGRIWDGQVTLNFQEEGKFLEWLDLGWIEPEKREAQWGKFRRDYRG